MKAYRPLLLGVLGGCWLAGAQANDEAVEEVPPDLDFLEYLGSWQDSDADWLIVSEWDEDELPRADGRPEADEDESD